MSTSFAFECHADEDVYSFLRDKLRFDLKPIHSYSQGEVNNDLLVKSRASLGMVDEDPLSTHHSRRDAMPVKSQSPDVEHRSQADRTLIILRPDLETCVFKALRRLKLKSSVAESAEVLHRLLGSPARNVHEKFRSELAILYEEAASKRQQTFLHEIETIFRSLNL